MGSAPMSDQGERDREHGDRRASGRLRVGLRCSLTRDAGPAIVGRTVNVGVGGMLVVVARPLEAGESVAFELDADGAWQERGVARVVREQALATYGLRFE